MKIWRPLKAGDIVDVVAPGWACTLEDLQNGLEILREWDLKPRVPADLFVPHLLFSAPDEIRLKHLKKALTAKDSTAIWCVRAGSGSQRLLPALAKLKKPKTPKLVVGLSDVTSLHLFLQQKWGWASLHTSMLDRLGKRKTLAPHFTELTDYVFGRKSELEYLGLEPLNAAARKQKLVRGEMLGGNLCVLTVSLGTPWHFRPRPNSLLFLEDIDERGYRIERMLMHLTQAGALKNIRGIVLGDFTGGYEKDGTSKAWPVFMEFAASQKIPVLKGVPCGHGDVQRPIPLGVVAELRTGPKASLRFKMRGPGWA